MLRRLRRDAELGEQPREVGVVAVVHHDEAGVDVMGLVRGVDADRVRVPARVGAGLVDDDLVLARSRCAATSPETPAPTIAILIAGLRCPPISSACISSPIVCLDRLARTSRRNGSSRRWEGVRDGGVEQERR